MPAATVRLTATKVRVRGTWLYLGQCLSCALILLMGTVTLLLRKGQSEEKLYNNEIFGHNDTCGTIKFGKGLRTKSAGKPGFISLL